MNKKSSVSKKRIARIVSPYFSPISSRSSSGKSRVSPKRNSQSRLRETERKALPVEGGLATEITSPDSGVTLSSRPLMRQRKPVEERKSARIGSCSDSSLSSKPAASSGEMMLSLDRKSTRLNSSHLGLSY